jgi:tetratricopeptide (TPR) repeat protein
MRRSSFFVALLLMTSTAYAQTIEQALELYRGQDYSQAAQAFYDVLRRDPRNDVRDQAEIYLADTLGKMNLLTPALFYYTDVFKAGKTNRYYLNAVEGLLDLGEKLHDPVFVPNIIGQRLDPQSLGQLGEKRIAQVNYIVGELLFRQGKDKQAQTYLEYVGRQTAYYTKALYLLGLIDTRLGEHEQALHRYKTIVNLLSSPTEDQKEIRALAQLAAARVAYGLGKYSDASKYFAAVPRQSGSWFDAMYENAWARFRNEEYGKSLGELQSVTSPYFSKRHIPEAYVILGTAYFVNCQWDRVRGAVAEYKTTYEPMEQSLRAYLDHKRDNDTYYRDVIAASNGLPEELARQIRRQKRFKDYYFMLDHMRWEVEQIHSVGAWQGTRLPDDLATIVSDHAQQLQQAAGIFAQSRLKNLALQLQNLSSQIAILDFEVTDGERQWLEQGREILKGRRARLPRPEIPNDQWQHWDLQKEYWKDELGNYQVSMRTECE